MALSNTFVGIHLNINALKTYFPIPGLDVYKIEGDWPDMCDDLHPVHLNLTKFPYHFETRFPPYTIASNDTSVELGDKVNITISSEKLITFQNYIMQAKWMQMTVGQFEKTDDNILYDCFGGKEVSLSLCN